MCQLGMSVSNDRVIQVCTSVANALCRRHHTEQIVCPPLLRRNVRREINALDNVDHSPSSTTAKDSFHGTSLNSFCFPTPGDNGYQEYVIIIPQKNESETKLLPLPESYSTVPPAALREKNLTLTAINVPVKPPGHHFEKGVTEEEEWLSHEWGLLKKDALNDEEYMSWAAYHASKCTEMGDICHCFMSHHTQLQ